LVGWKPIWRRDPRDRKWTQREVREIDGRKEEGKKEDGQKR